MQRVNLELTSAALLQSIIAESNHDQSGFISDVDIITVYLEHMVRQHSLAGKFCDDFTCHAICVVSLHR